MSLLDYLQTVLPACVAFGPLFLIIAAKDARRTRLLRSLGAVMVGAALMITWFVTKAKGTTLTAPAAR